MDDLKLTLDSGQTHAQLKEVVSELRKVGESTDRAGDKVRTLKSALTAVSKETRAKVVVDVDDSELRRVQRDMAEANRKVARRRMDAAKNRIRREDAPYNAIRERQARDADLKRQQDGIRKQIELEDASIYKRRQGIDRVYDMQEKNQKKFYDREESRLKRKAAMERNMIKENARREETAATERSRSAINREVSKSKRRMAIRRNMPGIQASRSNGAPEYAPLIGPRAPRAMSVKEMGNSEFGQLKEEMQRGNKMAEEYYKPSAKTGRMIADREAKRKAWHAGSKTDEDISIWTKDNRDNHKRNARRDSSGDDGGDRIDQMPQNPLMGRFAQWGMMASGAAASIFLVQMIGQQLANLMDVIMKWEGAVKMVTESFNMNQKDSEKMSETIRAYSRNLGLSQTDSAGAIAAAGKYGKAGSAQSVEQLYGLKQSNMVEDYREAAMVMSLAGTEFGDRAADQYLKKYKSESRQGEDAGSFGFEWEAMKGAGKEAMIHVFSGRDVKYGKSLTKTMMEISKWTNANRDFIGTGFDIVVKSIQAMTTALKFFLPAATLFAGFFVVSNSMKMFSWMLTGLSDAVVGLATKLPFLSKAVAGSIGIMGSLGPAALAVGVAFGGWKLITWGYDLWQFNKLLEKSRNLTAETVKNMSQGQVDSMAHAQKNAIAELTIEIEKLIEVKKKSEALGGASSMFMKPFQFKNDMDLSRKEKQKKDLQVAMLDTEKDLAKSMGLALPKNVNAVKEWQAAFESINAELGIMTDQLLAINKGYRHNDMPDLIAAVGGPMAAAITSHGNFNDMLANDPKVAGKLKLSTTRASMASDGFTAGEEKAYMLRQERAQHQSKYDQALGTRGKTGIDGKYHADAIAGINKELANLSTKNGFEDLITISKALYGTNKSIAQMNMTDFDKKADNINRLNGSNRPKAGLYEGEKVLYTNKLSRDRLRAQGKNPDLEDQKANIMGSNLPSEIKTATANHVQAVDDLKSMQTRIDIEKAKGQEFLSKDLNALELKYKNLKATDRFKNLGIGKQEDYDRIMAYNAKISKSNLSVSGFQQDKLHGNIQSGKQGFMTEAEAMAGLNITMEKLGLKIDAMDSEKYSAADKQRMKNLALGKGKQDVDMSVVQEALKYFSNIDRQKGQGMSDNTIDLRKRADVLSVAKLGTQGNTSQATRDTIAANKAFELLQDTNANKLRAWDDYYDRTQVMTAEHYSNEKAKIDNAYRVNEAGLSDHLREMERIESMRQLDTKNRRTLGFSEDMSLAGENVLASLTKSYQTFGEMTETTMTRAFNGISRTLTQGIMGTKDFKDAFKDMARAIMGDLVQMIIKQEMFNLLFGAGQATGGGVGGMVGMLGRFFGSANGNVVNGISAYSNQVVSSPTFVPGGSRVQAYATGGALFGEAGPEAIMPLSRMSSGNLGVEVASGGGSAPNIEIRIENNGKPVDAKQKEMKWDASQNKFICGIVLDAVTKNTGNFRTVLKGSLTA